MKPPADGIHGKPSRRLSSMASCISCPPMPAILTMLMRTTPHTSTQTLPELYKQLRANGLPEDTPAVAVERGTTPGQRIIYAPLSELPCNVVEVGLRSPTLLVIGQVVALSPGWQEWQAAGRPLEFVGASWGAGGSSGMNVDVLNMLQPSLITARAAGLQA